MKTIKIDEEAYKILASYKIGNECKTYSETIKKISQYIEKHYLNTIKKKD